MARELLAAHRAGRVQVAIGRASNYFGARGGAQSNLGDRVMRAALGSWVLEQACDKPSVGERFTPTCGSLMIAVNLSLASSTCLTSWTSWHAS
jgi:hypothetical protein